MNASWNMNYLYPTNFYFMIDQITSISEPSIIYLLKWIAFVISI